ncbi:MAG: ABC transporter substrate-binding protein, partial [Actinobacteria bacterium]|nr:ABC transporter substrate-binding protein [Actinomycetota bacterium]
LGDVALQTATFNAGGDAVQALFTNAVDLSFMGPNPAINAYAQSDGAAVRIIAGSTSGGASLVVAPQIQSIADLRGTTISTPALGNTQDVALRAWLAEQGFEASLEGGGDVSIAPQDNAQTLETFRSGEIQGAWVPEPWATRLVLEGGGHVLIDERDLWPGGQFVTTHLVVSTTFLDAHPDLVMAILRGLIRAQDLIASDPLEAQQVVNRTIEEITGRALPDEVISGAWANLTFTLDPIASSLAESAADAVAAGLLEPVDLDGIYDLSLLNELLRAGGEPEVSP